MNEHFSEFIKLLNKHLVKYVLVGGWAVIFKGYARTTGDMDFLVEISVENSKKIILVLKEFFGSSVGFSEEDFLEEEKVIMLGRPPFRLDILTSVTGVGFSEIYDNSVIYENEGFPIRCIHINQLIQNKKATGRLKDLADADYLERIQKKRKFTE